MIVTTENRTYETKYFPFFLKEKHDQFSVYTIRYPSGFVEEVLVFDKDNYMPELHAYLEFLVVEYMLEEDIALTPMAQRLKRDICDLFQEVAP